MKLFVCLYRCAMCVVACKGMYGGINELSLSCFSTTQGRLCYMPVQLVILTIQTLRSSTTIKYVFKWFQYLYYYIVSHHYKFLWALIRSNCWTCIVRFFTTYAQVGHESDLQQSMLLELFCQIIEESCFDQLRTKEQLGYMVYSGVYRNPTAVPGLCFLVQSDRGDLCVDGWMDGWITMLTMITIMRKRMMVMMVMRRWMMWWWWWWW